MPVQACSFTINRPMVFPRLVDALIKEQCFHLVTVVIWLIIDSRLLLTVICCFDGCFTDHLTEWMHELDSSRDLDLCTRVNNNEREDNTL